MSPKPLHRRFDDTGDTVIIGVHRLARLEERVRVLRRAADERVLRAQAAGTMGTDKLVVDHRADFGVAKKFEGVQLMRGAEPIEEMHERHARFQCRHLRDQRAVVRLLHRAGTEQRKSAGAAWS